MIRRIPRNLRAVAIAVAGVRPTLTTTAAGLALPPQWLGLREVDLAKALATVAAGLVLPSLEFGLTGRNLP